MSDLFIKLFGSYNPFLLFMMVILAYFSIQLVKFIWNRVISVKLFDKPKQNTEKMDKIIETSNTTLSTVKTISNNYHGLKESVEGLKLIIDDSNVEIQNQSKVQAVTNIEIRNLTQNLNKISDRHSNDIEKLYETTGENKECLAELRGIMKRKQG